MALKDLSQLSPAELEKTERVLIPLKKKTLLEIQRRWPHNFRSEVIKKIVENYLATLS